MHLRDGRLVLCNSTDLIRGIPMLLRPLSCAFALALLCACTSVSEITATGPHTYRVTYNAGAKFQTWVEVKNIARKQAEDHCESLGQRLSQPKTTRSEERRVGKECVGTVSTRGS